MKEMFISKLLDLANYLMTALLVGYFIDPSSGNNRHVSFSAAMLFVALMYGSAVLISIAFELVKLYNKIRGDNHEC